MPIWDLDVDYASDENDFELIWELDGVRYLVRFTWNTRDEAWRLSFYLPDGTPLSESRRVVLSFPLLRGEIDDRLPPGVLMAIDATSSNADVQHDDLLDRVHLVYYDAQFLATGE